MHKGALLRKSQVAVTLIELMVVISIATMLMSAGAPAMLDAMQRGSFNERCEQMRDVFAQARELSLARTSSLPDPTQAPHFGVAIIPPTATTDGEVVLIYGDDFNAAWNGASSRTRARIPRGMHITVAYDNAGLTRHAQVAPLGWFYAFGTGQPIVNPTSQLPIPIGTPARAASEDGQIRDRWGNLQELWRLTTPAQTASPVCTHLSLRQGTRSITWMVSANGLLTTLAEDSAP